MRVKGEKGDQTLGPVDGAMNCDNDGGQLKQPPETEKKIEKKRKVIIAYGIWKEETEDSNANILV